MQEVFLTYGKVREANLFICQECNAREGYYGNMEVAMTQGFDHDLYMKMQTEQIVKRIEKFDNKLYLEFGGKLFDDYHAARVLPGFEMNAKIRILQELKEKTEIIFCIGAGDIEKNKVRADIGITYDMDVLRLIDSIRRLSLTVSSVVITRYTDQPAADTFRKKLEMLGLTTYIHRPIKGYPTNVDLIVSQDGYGSNPYIETTKPLVVVTGPGAGSGKLATCLSQVYYEHTKGIHAGYAKFETFPIWNLPLKHPVNLAYEAATADLNDVNMIDPFHLEAYGTTTVNYNRDIEAFPVVKTILSKVTGDKDGYQSPTDMGVNMAGFCIVDDECVREASKQEVLRRYYKIRCDHKMGRVDIDAVEKVELIMKALDLEPTDRTVVEPALEKAEQTGAPAVAAQLPDGSILTGKTSDLMTAPAAMTLNSLKYLAGIADEILLLSPVVLKPILRLKKLMQPGREPVLNLKEVLTALSICEATNPLASLVLAKLPAMKGCEVHCSNILSVNDEQSLRELGLNVTCEPEFPTKNLYNL